MSSSPDIIDRPDTVNRPGNPERPAGTFPRRTPLLLFFLVLSVYAVTARNLDLSAPIGFQHQLAQADAFLHGRLHLEGFPAHEELAYYNDRAHIAAPPGPAVVLLPFVALAGAHFNPVPLHFLAAAASTALMWSVLRARGTGEWASLILCLGLAFGTVLWWCSRQPGSWHMAHVFSFLFLSLALWVVHVRPTADSPLVDADSQLAGAGRPLAGAAVAGALVAASALCRQLTFFAFPFVLYRLVQNSRRSSAAGPVRAGSPVRVAAFFLLGLSLPILAYMVFNWARFEDPLEGGYKHLYLRSPGLERFQQFGLFSVHYLPENLYTILFAAPRSSPDFPYLAPEYAGQALIFTSPFLFLAFRATSRSLEHLVLWACVFLMLVPQLLYFNNGFAQFGYRFALDFTPLLVLLTAGTPAGRKGTPARPDVFLIALVAFSIGLNAIGVYQL